jgi:hypothetical protein
MNPKRIVAGCMLALLVAAGSVPAGADTDAKTDLSNAKQGIKDAGHSIGAAFKKAGHQIGDGVRHGYQTVKGKFHHSAQKVADKTAPP